MRGILVSVQACQHYDLGHDEMVHVEELRELRHRQVCFHGPVAVVAPARPHAHLQRFRGNKTDEKSSNMEHYRA